MDDRTVDLIFAGSLESLPPVSSKIVRIFTSSTFTDTTLERNTLMAQVYPKIKDFCREKHGLEFQVVDMRWGVRDEATDDHMTTELCMKEIENCQRLSMGPNFVVFLGQKYGYRPIPTYILSSELQMLRDELVAGGTDASLLDLWYRKDANAVPPVSVLQPISSILVNFNNKRVPKLQQQDQAVWWDTLGKMQKLLRKASLSLYTSGTLSKDAMHSYFMSVTEREVINGILNVKNTRNHCLAYVRYINNINLQNLRKASLFIDILNRSIDTEAIKLLSNLRDERLPAKIESSNLQRYTVEWIGREGLDTETHEEYLSHFLTHFYRSITKLVDRAMRKEDSSAQGQIVTEILQHLHACNNSVKVFYGREDDLERIHVYMLRDQTEGDSNAASNEERRPLVLHGEGGCGKTSLLAKSASMTPVWFAGTRPVCIIRFLGTTPDSSALTPTLISICQQISYNYMLPFEDIPDDLVPLMAHFKHLLTFASAQQPLLLFLDSVDQLTGAQGANKVSWLPTRLPPHCKIVVSCAEEADNTEVSRDYHLLRRMIDVEENFIKVTDMGEDLAMQVIRMWMRTANRDLSNYQWRLVANAIGQCSLPIFVKLVFAEVCRWRSYTKPQETHLASTVMDSIMMLFERIEKQHGRILVFHALAYITAAKSGLSESELEDLISLDDKVLDDVYQYHMPPVRRIPPLLWTRIRNDLPNYLSEREADGVNVLNWYHRQFRETAKERYFKNMNMATYFHSSIADYYSGIWGGGNPKPFRYTEIQRHRFNLTEKEGSADRKVPVQPLVFLSKDGKVSRYNLRKFGEMPYHLVRSRRFEDLFSHVLFNYQWLHAKLSSCPLQAVLSDFEDACNNIEDREATRETIRKTQRELVLVADALRLGGAVLGVYPDMLAPQLVGRLLPEIGPNPNVRSLLRQCDAEGPEHCALIPYFHCLHTPGGPLKYSLEGHQFAVFGFKLTADYRYVVSISNKFITWDLSTSDLARDVNPGLQGIMQQLVLSPDNRFGAAYTNNNQTVLLNMLTNEFIILDNPLDEGERVLGLYLLNAHLFVHGKNSWCRFDMRGRLQEKKFCIPPGGDIDSTEFGRHWPDPHCILSASMTDVEMKQNGNTNEVLGTAGKINNSKSQLGRESSNDAKAQHPSGKKLSRRESQLRMQQQNGLENDSSSRIADSASFEKVGEHAAAAAVVQRLKKQRTRKDNSISMMSELENENSGENQSQGSLRKNLNPNILLLMEYCSLDTYRFIYWTGDLEDPRMTMQTTKSSIELEPFYFHSAMVMTRDKSTMFCCSTPSRYLVSKHHLGDKGWEFICYLPLPLKRKRLKLTDEGDEEIEENADTEKDPLLNGWGGDEEPDEGKDVGSEEEQQLLQLKLDNEEATLLGTASYGFIVWQDVDEGLNRSRQDAFCDLNKDPNAPIVHIPVHVTGLPLPYGVRNISTRLLQSNSVVVSANGDVAIAGVRKNLYVWKLEDGELMKVLDAHFGRILSLEPLTIGNWNSVITSSIDRTVKVWNINNIFEQVHVIDRHELQIDSISLSQEAGIVVTVTRGCVGVWDIQTGRLRSRLADSPLGAIVTHAQITANGKYIVSSESGNILIWNRLLEQVLFRDEQPGIVQLSLIEGGSSFLAVSRPSSSSVSAVSPPDISSSSPTHTQGPQQSPAPEDQTSSRCVMVVRDLPSGLQRFSYEFSLRSTLPYRDAVVTMDNQYLVIISNSGSGTENEKPSKKGNKNKAGSGDLLLNKRRDSSSSTSTSTSVGSKRTSSAKSNSSNTSAAAATASPVTTLIVLNLQTGSLVHRVPLRLGAGKDPLCLVPMPNKPQQVAVVTSGGGDSGAGGAAGGGAAIVDVRTRRMIRWISRWSGHMTKDGKFGLCAPPRGGLELLELKKGGGTIRTFIPRVAEGVFTVATAFNRTDEYVMYYHSGHKTLRIFRTADGTMIANYRVQAEVSALASTEDGMAVVIGTVDGCLSVLAIADQTKPHVGQFLGSLPSRDEGWKKKLEKRRASTRFKAAASVAQLVTHFNSLSQHYNTAEILPSNEE